MRAILVYWIIGCLIVGGAAALRANKCPNERTDMAPAMFLAKVAVWPAGLSAYLYSSNETIERETACLNP